MKIRLQGIDIFFKCFSSFLSDGAGGPGAFPRHTFFNRNISCRCAGYISVEKGFVGKKTRTVCRVTDTGREAFEQYVEDLKNLLNIS